MDYRGGGAYLVYNRSQGGHKHLFRAGFEGTGEIQLTAGDHDNVYPEIEGDLIWGPGRPAASHRVGQAS
jgi:hypothetical protein